MKKNNKGFSVLEVMLTFIVITIVSITAFSIFNTSNKNIVSSVYEKEASVFLTNALELYKYNPEEFDFYLFGLNPGDDSADLKTEKIEFEKNGKIINIDYFVKQFGEFTAKFTVKHNGDDVFYGFYEKNGKRIFEIAPYKKGTVG